MKKLIELKRSIFGIRSFKVKETKDLQIEVKNWQEKVRIEISINCPYTMNFMLDLNENDTLEFIKLLTTAYSEFGG